jgi:tetratricopeptide (TPR) repeat protein
MQTLFRNRLSPLVFASVLLVAIATRAHAQEPGSVFARAKQLVTNGNGAAGRLLIDSVITATPADSPTYAEALYWRGALAGSNIDAERDYRRVVVEYPASPRAGDALLALAQLELTSGDQPAATQHLLRFVTENPTSPERARINLQLVKLLFDQNDLGHGCTVLRSALSELSDAQVETRNQLDYYSPRCVANDAGAGGSVPAPGDPTGASAKRDSSHSGTPNKKGATDAKFTLQIAAYKAKSDADALAKRLKARKLDVRVVGVSKLFRVRIGRYATRAEAVTAQKDLKTRKIDGFITDIGPDDK